VLVVVPWVPLWRHLVLKWRQRAIRWGTLCGGHERCPPLVREYEAGGSPRVGAESPADFLLRNDAIGLPEETEGPVAWWDPFPRTGWKLAGKTSRRGGPLSFVGSEKHTTSDRSQSDYKCNCLLNTCSYLNTSQRLSRIWACCLPLPAPMPLSQPSV